MITDKEGPEPQPQIFDEAMAELAVVKEAYELTARYCDELYAMLDEWRKEPRTASSIANDCENDYECKCLYCQTISLLYGKDQREKRMA